MIPVRILLVEDNSLSRNRLEGALADSGTIEVFSAASPAAGMIGLARLRPDVLVLNPYAGLGALEEWRRAVDRYRSARPLSVVALADRVPERDRGVLEEMADLGVVTRTAGPRLLETILANWAAQPQPLGRAA